jgi:hypothetical protein
MKYKHIFPLYSFIRFGEGRIQASPCKSNICSLSPDIPNLLQNPKVHYRVHKSLQRHTHRQCRPYT